MPRLIAGGPGKRKFWHAWVDGTDLVVNFGKLGTSGQEQTKSFDTTEAADKELAKLVKQKLAKGYADAAWTWTCDESGLSLREIVDLPPRPEDASLARELVDLHEGSWSGSFWHGDYTLGLDKQRDGYAAGLIDRSGARAKWRPFDPPIVGPSFANDFDATATRFIVACGGGPAHVFDCKTLAHAIVAPAGDDIAALTLVEGFAAVLRKKGKTTRLELYSDDAGKWTLAKTIACHRQDSLMSFGGGRGLIVTWDNNDEAFDGKAWPCTHFLGVSGGEARLLGTFGLNIEYAFEVKGRSFVAITIHGHSEMLDLDAALARVAKKKTPTSLA